MADIRIGVIADTDDARRALESFGDEAKQGGLSITDFKSAVDLAGQGLSEIKKVFDATVMVAAEWGDTIGDLSQLTGTSAEETSRMAATFELAGVEISTLESAMKAMTKNGLQLNIETLKKLAVEYQSLKDPVAQNEFLMKKFGRAGIEMAEIMGRSAEELDKLSAAASVSGKVIGDDAAAAAENFNVQLEILKQRGEGAAITIGNAVIPTLTQAIDGFDNYTRVAALLNLKMQEGIGLIDQHQLELRAEAVAAGDLSAVYTAQLTPATEELTVAIDAVTKNYQEFDVAAYGASRSAYEVKAAQDAAKESAASLKLVTMEYSAIAGQAVENELRSYQDKQRDIGGQIADTKTKLEELDRTPHLTDEQRTQMSELYTRYGELKKTYEDNAEAHNLATRKIILNYIEQQLAADGLTQSEIGYLLDIGEQWGIYGDDTKRIWEATVKTIKDGALDADATMRSLGSQFPSYFQDIHRTITYDIHTNGNVPYGAEPPGGTGGSGNAYSGGGEGGGNGMRASGGSVMAGQAYMVGERGPEMFVPNSSGQIIPNNHIAYGGVTINVGGAGNPQAVAAAVRAELDRVARSAENRSRF